MRGLARLEAGEQEAIVLAQERQADIVLVEMVKPVTWLLHEACALWAR
jgi:hypothetical protein